MKLLTVPEMVAVEKAADAAGHSFAEMMEHAGRGLAAIVHAEFGARQPAHAVALAGRGNNGGDALVALDYLARWGWQTTCVLVSREPDALTRRAVEAGCRMHRWSELDDSALRAILSGRPVLLDGLLGTGIRLPLRPPADACLALVRHLLPAESVIVAVDTPSGVDCGTGAAAPETLRADLTVTMAAAKVGHFAFPAADYVGELRCAGIGLPENLETWTRLRRRVVDPDMVRDWLPARPRDAHKGTFGTALIAAGSCRFVGAALLAGKAAFRIGAGRVTTACPISVYERLAGHFPESTWLPLPEQDGALTAASAEQMLGNLERADSFLFGPGFSLSEGAADFVERLLDARRPLPPLVVDADGLKLLAARPDWPARLPKTAVLTPHPGEMSRLTGMETADIQTHRLGTAERFAQAWGHVVVLKGAFTVIAAPDGRTDLVPIASPALARAGTGDVLAGMIAGLRAQGLDAFEAAAAGAWLHARSGQHAAARIGHPAAVLAGDVLDALGEALREIAERGA